MEIQLYLDILRRRIFNIAIVAAATLILVSVVGYFITPVYMASATVRVFQDVGVSALSFSDDLQGDRLTRTYVRVLTSGPVLAEAAKRAGKPAVPVAYLNQQLTVDVIEKTELIGITFEDADPRFARDFVNALTQLLIEHAQNLYVGTQRSSPQIIQEQLDKLSADLTAMRAELARLLAEGATSIDIETVRNQISFNENAYNQLLQQYELARLNEAVRANSIVVIEPAVLPTYPANNLRITDVIIAMFVGIAGGIALALVLENLDTRIHSPRQLQRLTKTKVIGAVPKGFINLAKAKKKWSRRELKRIEAYRLLATNLYNVAQDVPLKKIIITSPMLKDGKSMVSSNLTQVLSERRRTVFLVECDLRRPVLNERFYLNNGNVGLSSYLTELVTLDQIIHPTESPSLFVISSGPAPPNPTQLLNSLAMDNLLNWVDSQAQMAILDTPPVLGLADVSVLAPKVDGVLLVVSEGQTTKETLAEAIAQLDDIKAILLGIVFVQKSNKKLAYYE